MTDRDLTGAWALDALPDDERLAFERYLRDDDDASAEATELADTAVLLGLAIPPVTPPPALRNRVLATVEGIPQVAPRDRDDSAAAPVAAPVVDRMPQGRHHAARRGILSTGRTLRFTRRTAAMLATSLAVLAALVVGGVTVRGLVAPTTETQAIAQIQDAADARTARASIVGGGTATVTWSAAQERSALAVADASPTPADRVYQLWYINGGKARSAGLFSVGASGRAAVALEGRLRAGDTVGVTIEPKGGSTSPTTKPIVAVETA